MAARRILTSVLLLVVAMAGACSEDGPDRESVVIDGRTFKLDYAVDPETRELGFGPEVKRRIMLGTFVLREGSFAEYYGRAQRVRTLIAQDYEAAFDQCDAIASPTSPVAGFLVKITPVAESGPRFPKTIAWIVTAVPRSSLMSS